MKRLLLIPFLAAPLLLAGPLPAVADNDTPPTTTNRAVPAPMPQPPTADSTAGDTETGKHAYLRNAHAEMHEWQDKLRQFDRDAAAKGREVTVAAKKDLHTAWAETKVQSHKLEKASAEGWEQAKVAFETAAQRLHDTWQRVEPDRK